MQVDGYPLARSQGAESLTKAGYQRPKVIPASTVTNASYRPAARERSSPSSCLASHNREQCVLRVPQSATGAGSGGGGAKHAKTPRETAKTKEITGGLPLLLGITKASLSMDSFISAASRPPEALHRRAARSGYSQLRGGSP